MRVIQRSALVSVMLHAAHALAQAETPTQASGSTPVQRPSEPVPTLSEVTVRGAGELGTTEGSGQYRSDAMGTATGLKLSPKETPQSASVVTRQEIEDRGLTDTGAIMASAPGIAVTRNDSNRWSFSSRGFSIDNFQFDGLSAPILNLWNYGDTDLDAYIYDRVEIVRGSTGLMTGAGNPSAAVNFIRKKPLREFAAAAEVSAGRWGQRRAAADLSIPFTRDGGIRARVVAVHNKGDSYVTLLDSNKRTLYGIVSADLTPVTLLNVGMEYQHNRGGGFGSGFPLFYSDGTRTQFDRSVSNNTRWSRFETESRTTFVDVSHRFDNRWNVRAAYSHNKGDYHMKQLYRGGYPDRTTGRGMSTAFANYQGERARDDVHLMASGPFSLGGRQHELSFGWVDIDDHSDIEQHALVGARPDIRSFFEWRDNRIVEPQWASARTTADDLRTKQRGAYAVGRFTLADPLHLIVGARVSQWEMRQTYFGAQRAYKISRQFTPYAGVVYYINPTYSAYASYTEIFRPQNNRAPDGNILDPVDGKSYELGLKASYLEGRLNAAASIYQTRQNNLAQAIPGVTVSGMPGVQAYRLAKGAKVEGFELEANGALTTRWNLASSITHYTAKEATGQPINTHHPRSLFKLYTTYRMTGALRGLTLGGGLDWQGSSYQTVASPKGSVKVGQGSYALLHLLARYEFNRHVSASLHIHNALDRHYYSQIGSFSQGWWGAPRNVTLMVKAQY